MRVLAWGLCAAFSGVTGACTIKECNEMGCTDGISMSLNAPDGTWVNGAYSLAVTLDGTTHSCDISVPEDLPTQPGQVGTARCVPQLSVAIVPVAVCTETRTGDAISQSCTPIPGQFFFSIDSMQTPSQMRIALQRDGTEVLRDERTLVYSEERPNGPDCGPVCRRASVTLTASE